MIVAIHQPNFFPWLGYFAKIARADRFVLLDNVEFTRGSWINRVKLLVSGQARWATAPVCWDGSHLPICDMRLDDRQPWRGRFRRTLEANYGRTPHFTDTMAIVDGVLEHPTDKLADFNEIAIRRLCEGIGVTTEIVSASALRLRDADCDPDRAKGSVLLAGLCRALDGDTYLAGQGASGYEDLHQYELSGIAYRGSSFRILPYAQRGAASFIGGLSILDALFNVGPQQTSALIADAGDDAG